MNHEEKARENGWVGQEEWVEGGKEADDWVSAREFNRAGELMGHIKSLRRSLNDTQTTIQNLNAHNAKLEKQRLEDKETQLKQVRDEAIEVGDLAAVHKVEEPLKEIEQAKNELDVQAKDIDAQLQAQGAPAGLVPAMTAFVEKNDWYKNDSKRRALFNVTADELMAEHTNSEELIAAANAEVERIFNPKPKPKQRSVKDMDVDPGGDVDVVRSTANKNKHSFRDLDSDAQRMVDRMIENGAFQVKGETLTKAQKRQKYVDQLDMSGAFS